VCFAPCLPPDWDRAEMTLRLRGKLLRVLLRVRGAHPHAGGDAPVAPHARELSVGEWISLSSLPPEAMLVVDVPAALPHAEEADTPAVVAA
jgi:hypothetical protein